MPAICHTFEGLQLRPAESRRAVSQSCFCHIDETRLSVSSIYYGRPLSAQYEMAPDTPVISVVTQGRASYRWGQGSNQHESIASVNFLPANTSLDMQFTPDCCQILIRFNPNPELNDLYRHLHERGPRNATLQAAIQRRVSALVHKTHYANSYESSRQHMINFEHQMMDVLMSSLDSDKSVGGIGVEDSPPLVSADILRVVDFMHAHPNWEFDIAELAGMLNTSVRSFYSLFKRTTGSTPYQYYLSLHLSMVRVALLETRKQGHTITGIAMEHGFYHLSRFSAQYKALFGELPSATAKNVYALMTQSRRP